MKTCFSILAIALCSLTLQSCEESDNVYPSNKSVAATFESKYPGATRIDSETRGNYVVVEFRLNSREHEAWFNKQGVWYMTEIELYYDDLPQAVKTAFKASIYGTSSVVDVDKVEPRDQAAFYVIEVEKREAGKDDQEFDLFYSAEGTLIKNEVNDNDDDDYREFHP